MGTTPDFFQIFLRTGNCRQGDFLFLQLLQLIGLYNMTQIPPYFFENGRVARRIDSRVVSKVGSKVYFLTLRLRDTHGILGHRLSTIVLIPSNCPPK